MRIIVGFFGLTRSLRFTAPAILRNIIQPLEALGGPVLRLGHFNLPEVIVNPRSNEIGVVPDRDEHLGLGLDDCLIEIQDDQAIASVLEVARAFPDRFGDGYRSVTNLYHQLNSLRHLWALIDAHGVGEHDVVLLLRPDLFYLDRLDVIRDIAPLRERHLDLVVPGWQDWGGINDRFAFCSSHAAAFYATRFEGLIEACLTMNGIHAETYLRSVIDRHGLRTGFTDLRAVRVRANGMIADNDMMMLTPRDITAFPMLPEMHFGAAPAF